MPQFDVSLYPGQIFWLFVCFSILYFCSSRFFLPRVEAIIKEREKRIQDVLTRSEQMNDEASRLKADREIYFLQVEEQSNRILRQAQENRVDKYGEQEQYLSKVLKLQIKRVEKEAQEKKILVFQNIQNITQSFLIAFFRFGYKIKPSRAKICDVIQSQVKELK